VGSALGGSLAIALGLARSDLFLFQSVFLVLVLKTGNLIYGIFMVGWQKSLDDLVLVNTQQRAVNSRLRQQLWLGQKALAMELHGSVQATLQALALKLSRMQDVNLAEIGQVLSQVRKALSRIENQEYLAGQEFISLLDELEELWDGTASIDWNISEQARLTLETDLGLARCTFEVIRESVTNAVKHGSATEIFIDIKQSDSALQLRITNDGSVADVQRDSLGSELMDQLCLTRELREEGKLVVLRAELALSPEALQQSPA
jgi:signal transduction histidine kinase